MRRAALILHIPIYALALIGFFTLGHVVTRSRVRSQDFREDVNKATVARSAAELAYSMLDHPLQRLFIPDWRVAGVRVAPGHCDDPSPSRELADYVADVRLYTLYGIPLKTVTVSCGGWLW